MPPSELNAFFVMLCFHQLDKRSYYLHIIIYMITVVNGWLPSPSVAT